METKAIVVVMELTDGCSTGSTGVASTIQTTQSSTGTLSNLQLQYRDKQSAVKCGFGHIWEWYIHNYQ